MAAKQRATSGVDWFLFGHFWIAIAAAGLAWTTILLTNGNGRLTSFHALVLLATLSLYSWHRIFSFRKKDAITSAPRYHLVAQFPILSQSIAVLAGLGSLALAFSTTLAWPLVATGILLAGGYVLPLEKSGNGWLRRSYFKPFIVAAGWALITAALALDQSSQLTNHWSSYLIILERFGYTLSVAICFDWRDRQLDQKQGISTIAKWPIKWSKMAAALALCLSLISCILLIKFNSWGTYAAALLFSYPFGFVLIYYLGRLKGDYKFAWLYNGFLTLPPLFIWLFITVPYLRNLARSIIEFI